MSVRPAKTQISLGTRPVWSESLLSAWRNFGSLATHWAQSDDSDQTGRMPRLIWVFAGRTLILLVLSWGGSCTLTLSCLASQFWDLGKQCRPRSDAVERLGSTPFASRNSSRSKIHEPVQSLLKCLSAMSVYVTFQWAATWQNQQSDCAPSEDSDQPGHPPSLIRVFAFRMKKAWVLSYPVKTLIRYFELQFG